MVKVVIKSSTQPKKRFMAIFYDDSGKKIKTTHFSLKDSKAYIDHGSKERRSRYIERHRKRENWDQYMTAGALARWITWGPSTSLRSNISAYKKRFNLK